MKKNSSALIAALTLTAIILGVVLISTFTRSADAAGMLNAQSEFTIMTAGPSAAGDEALIVMDRSAQKMVIYRLENGNHFAVIAPLDFGKILK